MKGSFHDAFVFAIRNKRKVMLTFLSKEKGLISRLCAPMDYAAGRNVRSRIPRYWFWDYDSDKGAHHLGLETNQIKELEVLDVTFDPSEFVRWNPSWSIARDWGSYS